MNKTGLPPLVSEVHAACGRLSLYLPTHAQAIEYQVKQIRAAQQQLASIAARIDKHPQRQTDAARQQQHLKGLILSSIEVANSLLLLAEEFPLDPVGAIACLRQVNIKRLSLFRQIQELAKRAPATPAALQHPSAFCLSQHGVVFSDRN